MSFHRGRAMHHQSSINRPVVPYFLCLGPNFLALIATAANAVAARCLRARLVECPAVFDREQVMPQVISQMGPTEPWITRSFGFCSSSDVESSTMVGRFGSPTDGSDKLCVCMWYPAVRPEFA